MKGLRPALVAAVSVLALFPATAFAQTQSELPELVTDRPDFTESSMVVGRGMLQVEMGVTLESDGEADERERPLTLPLALIRFGVSRRLELRLSTDGYVVNSIGTGPGKYTNTGHADVEVGAKYVLWPTGKRGEALAVIPIVSLPTGDDDFTSGTVDPTIKFTWAADLPKAFAISGNVNISRLSDDLGRSYVEQVLSVSVGRDLTGGWTAYWEVFGVMPHPDSNGWTVNTGISHLVGANAQVDFEVGRGVTTAATDWFIGAGVGLRTSALRGHR